MINCLIFLRFNKLTSMEQVSFKRRNRNVTKKVKLHFGKIGFVILKNLQFEYAYFFLIKRYLKYFFKFKYAISNYFKIWVFLKGNYPISKKSKNSRMGKGKGSFVSWLVKLNAGHTVMEFSNIELNRIIKLNKYWNKILNFKLKLIIK